MTETDFAGLSKLDVNVKFISSAKYTWKCGAADNIMAREGRKCDLLYLMLSGERRYYVDGKPRLTLLPGDIIFLPVGTRYVSRVEGSENSEGIFVDFSIENENGGVYVNDPFLVTRDEGLSRRFEAVADNISDRLRVRAEIFRILSGLSMKAAMNGLDETDREIRAIMLEIERHPERPLDVGQLSRGCCMSETGFRKRFKLCSGGLSPLEYRNRCRIDRADELLSSGNLTAAQIADMLGFYDTAHFYRTYKAARGHAPER
ncbi:MAG: helix-turn-helix domain-containing protein [Candidatus Flemingiibacterium sp.]